MTKTKNINQIPCYLATEAIAEILHTTPYTVRKWLQQGKMPSIRVGKRVLVDLQDFKVFCDSLKIQREAR